MSLDNMNLTGHFLIAMPNLTDPYFAKSVTFICTHNQDGAMGIVINRPTDMSYETLFEKINIKLEDTAIANDPVLYGGPVQPERGFVLHEPFGDWDSSITINEKTSLTTSKDILEAVAVGAGPKKLIFSLGYAGWTPNQLEQEIVQNSWLSVQAKDIETLNKILFETPHEEQLNAAISLLGFDPAMLSDVAGHA
ncbi:YqgE/AlgH family protein [Methylotenera sp.]|uniref:YqgE/AlgH family protein n=1 Tax=Methylotenera sp. TaxID=2051956 RepID=UPI0027328ECE|nr:YqgE/AlgH family protein [Methylotenera sp.]MDP3212291.1 YqgE/AlgH family protein [Methylotenera sp.]